MDDTQLAAMLRAELQGQRLRDAVKSVVERPASRNRSIVLLDLTGDGPNRRQDG